jgi:hypothetical protein
MPKLQAKRIGLPLHRRWIADMLHFANDVPVVAAERTLRLKTLALARRSIKQPPSWNSLLVKGLAVTAQRHPAMRQTYMPWPFAHLAEVDHSVACVVFDRDYHGEVATMMGPVIAPELMKTSDIHAKVVSWKTDPIHSHGALRRLERNAKFPWPVRRLLWNLGLYTSPTLRARNFGTFAVNSIAAMRGKMLMFQTPLTSVYYYGTVNTQGEMLLQMAFDHRVMDGSGMHAIVKTLEQILNDEFAKQIDTV